MSGDHGGHDYAVDVLPLRKPAAISQWHYC